MFGSKEIITALGSLGCALGIGFVMQNSESAQAHYGSAAAAIPASEGVVLEGSSAKNALLDVKEITLTSAEFDADGTTVPSTQGDDVIVSAPGVAPEAPQAARPSDVASASSCDITASARPVAAAIVDLSMTAPCFPNERITVHHNGMIFSETTTADGTLDIRIPALSAEPVFIIAFPNGEGAVAQTTVEELADYDRVVLQWKGNTGFQIHAREFGASYGDEGHIWEGAPGDLAATVAGRGGVLTRHGDMEAADPLLAEVYTFPKTFNLRVGGVALSVEAEVTETNCGLEIEAQSLEMQPDGKIKTQNLTLPVPSCEAKGDFLVLNNLLQDLKIAGN